MIVKIVDGMEKEARLIRSESLKMCWYMRGGVTYNDIMLMSQNERIIIGDIVKENLETTKKTQLPFF